MAYATRERKLSVPKTLVKSVADFYERWEEIGQNLEDFLLATDERFMKKMSRARAEHLAGKTKPLSGLKRALGLR